MDLQTMEKTIAGTDALTVEELCEEITARRRQKYADKTKPYPRSNPIASDISDCMRETVLGVTRWKERPEFPVEAVERMERGNQIENLMVRELMDLGYTVRVERQPFELHDKQGRVISRGKVDGFISVGYHNEIPFEGKSLTPMLFDRINTIEDWDRYHFFRKYPRQLQLYLLANNIEHGFWLVDDCLGHWKLIPCRLDYERAEKILKQLEGAVEHIANATLPDFHQDPQVCLKCWAFKRLCTPPFTSGEGMQVFTDPELAAKIARRVELEEAASEYDRYDREIKGFLKQTMKPNQVFIIGDFMVKAEEKVRNMKAQPAKEATAQKYLSFEFEKLA